MKATELIKLLEYKNAFKPEKAKRRRTRDFDIGDIDIALLIQKKLNEADMLRKTLDDREKANKKEDKKGSEWTILDIGMVLWATFPIIAYLTWVAK